MHFSIPETKEFDTFVGYNIYVNGKFHCCLRFKQLHSLHEQLKRSLPSLILPTFPPKKIFALTKGELEQRRLALERYLQLIGQDPVISKSNLLRSFLLNAQQESALIECYETNLDVFLMNGYRISTTIFTNECSMKVLEKAMRAIELPEEYVYYFSLFLVRKAEDGDITIVRKLMDFESPYITQKSNSDCKIVIRKSYWDTQYDTELMHDKIALNLLYIQTLSDIERGWIIATNDMKDQLSSLQSKGKKLDYMKMVSNLPSYGCIQFSNVTSDYPEENCIVTVIIGNKELGIRTNLGKKIQETKFKVTRMRCWRVTTILNEDEAKKKSKDGKLYKYELSFEYLMAKNILKWIKLVTEQAMLISVCLQSMVDELLNQKNGYDVNNVQSNLNANSNLNYIKRDQSSSHLSSSSSSISETDSISRTSAHSDRTIMTFSKLKEKLTSSNSQSLPKESIQNEAFDKITDDDL